MRAYSALKNIDSDEVQAPIIIIIVIITNTVVIVVKLTCVSHLAGISDEVQLQGLSADEGRGGFRHPIQRE